jgi:chromosome segregation ATPase
MGRTGVTYQDVSKAAAAIQAKGENPTIDRVREWLGTGSKGTITPLLKQWKHEQAPFLKETPNALPPDLLNLTHGLWLGMKQKADEVVETEKTRFSQHRQRLEKSHLEVTQRLQETQTQKEELESALDALKAAHEALTEQGQEQLRRIEYLTAQNSEQQQRIEANEATIVKLSEQSKLAYENLEHFRASAQAQREQEHLEFDRQRAEWFQAHKADQNTLALQASELAETKQVLDEVTLDRRALQGEKTTLEKTVARLSAEAEQRGTALGIAEDKRQKLEEQNTRLDSRVTGACETIKHLEQQLVVAQNQLDQYHRLNESLATIQQQLEMQGVLLGESKGVGRQKIARTAATKVDDRKRAQVETSENE